MFGGDVVRDVSKRFERLRPVNGLEIGLQLVIVGTKQRGESRGVAGAAEILHDQGIEKSDTLLAGKADNFRQAHTDETTTRRVSLTVSFGKIEGELETCENFRKPHLGRGCTVGVIEDRRQATAEELLLSHLLANRG